MNYSLTGFTLSVAVSTFSIVHHSEWYRIIQTENNAYLKLLPDISFGTLLYSTRRLVCLTRNSLLAVELKEPLRTWSTDCCVPANS